MLGIKAMSYLLLFIAVLVSCCSGPVQSDYDSDEDRILGEWDWLSSSGGIGGWTYTPETVGYRKIFMFSVDDTLSVWRADSLVWRSFYRLGIGPTIFGDSLSVIFLERNAEHPSYRYFWAGNDTLWLWENAVDGFSHELKRK